LRNKNVGPRVILSEAKDLGRNITSEILRFAQDDNVVVTRFFKRALGFKSTRRSLFLLTPNSELYRWTSSRERASLRLPLR
jgi:hypothetical protein